MNPKNPFEAYSIPPSVTKELNQKREANNKKFITKFASYVVKFGEEPPQAMVDMINSQTTLCGAPYAQTPRDDGYALLFMYFEEVEAPKIQPTPVIEAPEKPMSKILVSQPPEDDDSDRL